MSFRSAVKIVNPTVRVLHDFVCSSWPALSQWGRLVILSIPLAWYLLHEIFK